MGNVVNYIKWRGDLSFFDSPFNEVDNLALSLLIYNDFFGIVPVKGAGIKISIKDAAEWYFTKHSIDECSRLDFDWILYYMAKTGRFGDLYLSDYVDLNESEKDMMPTSLLKSLTSSKTSLVLVSCIEKTYLSGFILRITFVNALTARL